MTAATVVCARPLEAWFDAALNVLGNHFPKSMPTSPAPSTTNGKCTLNTNSARNAATAVTTGRTTEREALPAMLTQALSSG